MKEYLVYRGEYGARAVLSTQLGSLTFVDERTVAEHYARMPNQWHYTGLKEPKLIVAKVGIHRPFINTPRDPFIEFKDIRNSLGPTHAIRIARKFADSIVETDAWVALAKKHRVNTLDEYLALPDATTQKLCMQAYRYFDDPEEVKVLVKHHFDGAIYRGSGESMNCVEYRIFNCDNIMVLAIAPVR
ncbi:hypothetical protein PP187_gp009 [Klebsiella phage vB_KvM-Eowyn]|uniref:Uncharacterized protein n=1 Tax=Klebsiella phage vB_KvM-Eowyn TaxID=2762819 RepID=A0A7R8R9B7_9CAUD|nr:hypothetical protein PP187_gp009 [Klebsiella phage vB_KvM-Eowyn]CAD5235998.1 hypothetical protein LLCLJKAH_00009 [Klebsiella phage vB_KvM-Eowyn]